MTRHRLAELRQVAWADLGGRYDARSAWAARLLTIALNGHARDLQSDGPKRCYNVLDTYGDAGGLWGAWRGTWRSVTYAGGIGSATNSLMAANGFCGGGGRTKRWSGGGDEKRPHDTGSDTGDDAPVGKQHDLSNPEVSEILGSGGDQSGHLDARPAGGQHDWAWKQYGRLRNGYDIGEHREALTRAGRLPARMKPVKADAERIICALADVGVNDAAMARIFTCSERTIARAIKRNLTVHLLPIGGGTFSEDRLRLAA